MKTDRAARAHRMKALREGAKGGQALTQAQMADALQIPLATYQKWEQRGYMQMDYMPLFCVITHCSIKYYISGKD